jgi:hypothetical protein
MKNQQTPSTTDVWPFAFVNGERTKESQELMQGKHYSTKEVLDTNDYDEAPF